MSFAVQIIAPSQTVAYSFVNGQIVDSNAELVIGVIGPTGAQGPMDPSVVTNANIAVAAKNEAVTAKNEAVAAKDLAVSTVASLTTDLGSTTRLKGAGMVRMEDGSTVQGSVGSLRTRLSATVSALQMGRESTSGKAEIRARVYNLQQNVAHTPTVTERWRGVVNVNGRNFHVPYDAQTVLVVEPDTNLAWQLSARDLGLATDAFNGTAKWARAVVVGTKIYCIPYTATSVLVIDTVSMSATLETFGLPTSALSAATKWDGGAATADGLIYCAPYGASTVLVIDTVNQTARTLTNTQLGVGVLTGVAKYSGAVRVGTRIYFVPFLATNVMLLDTTTNTATTPNYGLTLSDSSKWSGACVVGTNIYCAPFAATDILVIDTLAQTAVRTAMGATLTGSNKFRGIHAIGNRLYAVPYGATNFLVIDPLDTTASPQGTATRNNFNAYDVRVPATRGDFNSSVKWAGGVVYKNILYGCPSGSVTAGQDILILDPAANAGAGQAFHTDLRAISLENIATKWFGGVQHPNGYSYCIPASATDFLIIKDDDPDNDSPAGFRSTLGITLAVANQKFQGGVLAGDSCIYAFPRSEETRILKIDPSDKTASIFGTATLTNYGGATDLDTGATNVPLGTGAVDEQKYHSCVVGMDGRIYGVPYNATKVLIMDPFAADADKLKLTNFGLNLSGADKWVGGCLHPNGKIYCGPRNRADCLVIDTNPDSPTYGQAWLTNFGVDLNAGANAGTTTMKWSYPKVGADGRIYVAPRTARNFLVIDPDDTSVSSFGRATFETFGLDMSSLGLLLGTGYTIATKMGVDGKLYCASLVGTAAAPGHFLIVDTISHKAEWQSFGLSSLLNSENKVAGVIHTLAGRLIFVPRSANYLITLKMKNVPPLPAAVTLGPIINAN